MDQPGGQYLKKQQWYGDFYKNLSMYLLVTVSSDESGQTGGWVVNNIKFFMYIIYGQPQIQWLPSTIEEIFKNAIKGVVHK